MFASPSCSQVVVALYAHTTSSLACKESRSLSREFLFKSSGVVKGLLSLILSTASIFSRVVFFSSKTLPKLDLDHFLGFIVVS